MCVGGFSVLTVTVANQSASTSTSTLASSSRATNNDSSALRFYGNAGESASSAERMRQVFGGRLDGSGREASSRRDVNAPRLIAGVLVPHKPIEPDNCCMSGCVNCVWEQYNDDIRDWRKKRNLAAEKLNQTEDIWPKDFDPPLKALDFKNVPRELRSAKRKLGSGKRLSSSAYFPTKGAPGAQNLKASNDEDVDANDDEAWGSVPVHFKVFAETEKRVKAKKLLQKKKQLEQEKAASTASIKASNS